MEQDTARVLVADDHDRMRECLVKLLRSEFLVMGAVSDGYELIEAAIRLNPDVIVTDIRMPHLNGTEAIKALQGKGFDVSVVFVTSNYDLVRHMSTTFEICVHKSDLVAKLGDAVRRAAAGRVRLAST